jgi:HK97 family phage portal protein
MAGTAWIHDQVVPDSPAKAQKRAITADSWPLSFAALGGGDVTTGSLTELPAVFRAIDLISGAGGFVPCLIEQTADGQTYLNNPSHPLYQVFNVSANERMDSFFCRKLLFTWYLVHGECYALLDWNQRGQLQRLIPLRNDYIYDDVADPANFLLYAPGVGKAARRISRDEVLHVRWMPTTSSFDRQDIGKVRSIASLFSTSLGAARLQTEYLKRFYQNGAQPGGLLIADGDIGEEGRGKMRAEWNRAHGGAENAFKIAILEAGVKYEPLKQVSMADQEFVRVASLHVADVSRIYGVPLHMLSEPAGSKYATAEQTAKEFLSFCMRNHLTAFASAITHSCLSSFEKARTRIRFDEEALASVSFSDVVDGLAKATTGGIMTRNEARRRLSLPPLDGGDELLVQQQMIPIKEAKNNVIAAA